VVEISLGTAPGDGVHHTRWLDWIDVSSLSALWNAKWLRITLVDLLE
jgi:hypothetical protein